jgi:hypothetical protein
LTEDETREPVDASSVATRSWPQQHARVVAVGITGVLALIAVYVVTRHGSDDETAAAPPATVTTTAPSSSSPASATTAAAGGPSIPKGDYGAFCAEVRAEVGPPGQAMSPTKLRSTMDELRFDRLIAAAPDWLEEPLRTIESNRDNLVALLGQVRSYDDIELADLPQGLPEAMTQVLPVLAVTCAPS